MIQRTWWPRLNPNAQLAKGLVFAGLGGGASTLQYADASGYGNHGTLTNMDPDWVFDAFLGRFCTNHPGGTSDSHVSIPNAAHLNFAAGFTVSVWCKLDNPTAMYNAIVAKGSYGQSYNFCTILNTSYGKAVRIYPGDGSNVEWSITHNTAWHHVVGTVTPTNANYYYDGVSQGAKAISAVTGTNTNPIQIGCAGTSYETDGLFADAMIWNRILSPAEIQQLADPSNTLLSGLILPPRRMVFPAAVAGGAYSLDCDSIAFTLSSMAPDLLVGHVLDAAAGEFTLAGQDAGLEQGYALSCDAGSFTLTGQDATLTATRTLSCDSGEFVLTGQDASLESGATLSAESGSVTLTGQDASLLVGHVLDAGSGEFTLTGQDVTLTYTPAGAYTITADAGSFSLTGQDATLTAARTLSCDSGTFTLAGQDATFQHGYTFACGAGSFTLSGQASTFGRTFALACDAGSFTLTGQTVTLTYSAAIGSIYGTWTPPARSRTWTPPARSRTWTPAARSRTWTPQSRGN